MNTVSTAILRSLTLCNSATSGTAACDVLVKPLNLEDVYLFRVTQVTSRQTIQPTDAAIVIGPGGALRVAASTANVMHVTASYLESE